MEKTQNNLYNINYDLSEKYYNDFQIYQLFSNYIEDKNNKLEKMINNIISIFNEIINVLFSLLPLENWDIILEVNFLNNKY